MRQAIKDVMAERVRQVVKEGWTAEHDDDHDAGEMACAGAAYALNAGCVLYPHNGTPLEAPPVFWMWDGEWWKPDTPRRDLVRAAALIIAEIERLDRATIERTPRWIFDRIVEAMHADNGCKFYPIEQDFIDATEPIEVMQKAGYFADDPEELDHSFWQAAAGEETEAREYFSRAAAAYVNLLRVLNVVFDDRTTP